MITIVLVIMQTCLMIMIMMILITGPLQLPPAAEPRAVRQARDAGCRDSEKGGVLLRGVGTLRNVFPHRMHLCSGSLTV